MFTMAKIKASGSSFGGSGKSFYHEHLSANDYYNEKEKVEGYWKGKLTNTFHLTGEKVRDREFSLFQQNINPYTGEQLTKRTNAEGIRFFDFQCSAQKSVSIMAMAAGDKRLADAHARAVDFAMAELERFAAVRVREGTHVWSNDLNITGNIIYAQYHHDASRSLDPQLHTHNVVVNCTYDHTHKELRALSEYEMCKVIRYAGKIYQNYMASEVLRLGYEIEQKRDKNGCIEGFEIKGITEDMMKKFSSRRADIEKAAEKFLEKEGRRPSRKELDVIARETRDRKLANISTEEVHKLQRSKLSKKELKTIEQIKNKAEKRKGFQIPRQYGIQAQINEVASHLFERKSVLSADKILAEVLNQNLGLIELQALKTALKKNENLIKLSTQNLTALFASKENVAREIYTLEAVIRGRDSCSEFNLQFDAFPVEVPGYDFNQQQNAIRTLLQTKDRFMLFQGSAGVGKTSALHELCRGIINGGQENIILIAPTNSAVAVLENEDLNNCHTVAKFLKNKRLVNEAENAVLIVDEASLNSVKQGTDLLKFAEEKNCRIIFVGDVKQHTSVEAGDFFRLLGTYSGIRKVELSEIHRQRSEDYRQSVKAIASGDIETAFLSFDSKGWIVEGKGEYLKNAADDFIKFTDGGRNLHKCIAVSPTNRECELITEEIRRQLKEKGIISRKGKQRKSFHSFKWSNFQKEKISSYKTGQEICFIKSPNDQNISIGQTFTIKEIKGNELILQDGKRLNIESCANQIEVGRTKEIELSKGDLIMFTVNDKKNGIINGNFALVENDRKLKLFDKKGQTIRTIQMDNDFSAFKYGFVTTSHKSQGQTKENVVIAAEQMDQKAFYVATSRGKENMRLHCPNKDILHDHIKKMSGDRNAALDIRPDLKAFVKRPGIDEKQEEELLKQRVGILVDYFIKIKVLNREMALEEKELKLKKQVGELIYYLKEIGKIRKGQTIEPASRRMEVDHGR